MSVRPIIFAGGQSSSLDELAGGVPPQVNVYTDAGGALRPRPGIVAWELFPDVGPEAKAITGIGSWNGYIVFSVYDDTTGFSNLYYVSPGRTATIMNAATASTTFRLKGSRRPIFTNTRADVAVTAGGPMWGWGGPGKNYGIGAGNGLIWDGWPSTARTTHAVAISQRVVANDYGPSGLLYWSGVGSTGVYAWEFGADFREAESDPDPIDALYKSAGELVAIGPRSIEMLSPDPSVTFTTSRVLPFGSNSPYAYVGFDEQFLLFDNKKRMMLSNGRAYEDVATPVIARELDRISSVSDAWGFRCNIDGHDFGVMNFPTAGRTFAYDLTSRSWCEWRSWVNGAWAPLRITAHCFDETSKTHLVGLADGTIAKLSATATSELGNPLVMEATSTFVDHGTMAYKLSEVVRFRFRRGLAASSTAEALVSYRDDTGPFCEPFRIPLGDSADVAPVVELRSQGTYQQRQWRIAVDSNQFIFAGAEEQFSVLQA